MSIGILLGLLVGLGFFVIVYTTLYRKPKTEWKRKVLLILAGISIIGCISSAVWLYSMNNKIDKHYQAEKEKIEQKYKKEK